MPHLDWRPGLMGPTSRVVHRSPNDHVPRDQHAGSGPAGPAGQSEVGWQPETRQYRRRQPAGWWFITLLMAPPLLGGAGLGLGELQPADDDAAPVAAPSSTTPPSATPPSATPSGTSPTSASPTSATSSPSGMPTSRVAPVVPGPGCAAIAANVRAAAGSTRLTFARGDDGLTRTVQRALRAVAAEAKDCSTLNLVVTGHADSRGTAARNRELGTRRAERVKESLVRSGIDPTAITVRSAGESRPIASNSTSAGRAKNRRVEITVR